MTPRRCRCCGQWWQPLGRWDNQHICDTCAVKDIPIGPDYWKRPPVTAENYTPENSQPEQEQKP